MERNRHAADPQYLSVLSALYTQVVAEAFAQQTPGSGGTEIVFRTGRRVIRVCVGDEGFRNREPGINVEAAVLAIESAGVHLEQRHSGSSIVLRAVFATFTSRLHKCFADVLE